MADRTYVLEYIEDGRQGTGWYAKASNPLGVQRLGRYDKYSRTKKDAVKSLRDTAKSVSFNRGEEVRFVVKNRMALFRKINYMMRGGEGVQP